MRFQLISLHEAALDISQPFEPHRLTEVDDYGCYLYRCEGETPLQQHFEHDELLWPLEHAIYLLDEQGETQVPAGHIARVPRGWKHRSASSHRTHVLLISRGKRALATNGDLRRITVHPPEVGEPLDSLDDGPPNAPRFLLRCDSLHLYAERVEGTGPARHAGRDVLVIPVKGSLGVRCGGIVVVIAENELVRIPAGSGWHLFGDAAVAWMTAETLKVKEA